MSERGRSPLRIANVSGFYGDKPEAALEMLEGGEVDFLTGDYLAELTMLILHKARERRPGGGFAATFLKQMEPVLGPAIERGVRIVVNAGGLAPRALAEALRAIAGELGVAARIAHIEGDDVLDRLPELQRAGHAIAHLDRGTPLASAGVEPVSANAYLGARGIVEALERGADVVVCPRVTDASLVVGPAVWHYGWGWEQWDELASAVVAGHVIECGPQTTGGNYAFFDEVPRLVDPGFPLVEIAADGSFVVTRHRGSDGLVSVGTVTAQLLYEIGGPRYVNPDVVARFDAISLEQEAPERVRVQGVRGEPRPDDVKLCLNYVGGYRNTVTFGLTGLDVDAKAASVERALLERVGGREQFDEVCVELQRAPATATTNVDATSWLHVTVKDRDPRKVGRAFSNRGTQMLLGSVPGIFTASPPGDAREFGVYWPALLPASELETIVCDDQGEVRLAAPEPVAAEPAVEAPRPALPAPPVGATRTVPLGRVVGARSGDKGGNANVGVWARTPLAFAWLTGYLTVERLRELMPEVGGLEVQRHDLPNLLALNFVVVGLLGDGVASCTRTDPQAKGLGEFLRSRPVEVPAVLIDGA